MADPVKKLNIENIPDFEKYSPNDLESYWMPFTNNQEFKKNPRMFISADGMYYKNVEGRLILDGIAGLWAVNAGHCRSSIVEAVQKQVATMDYATAFMFGHPKAFLLSNKLASLMPGDLSNVFFGNSGSEAVDTALKIALAYQRARGEGQRTRLIGRSRGYHGAGFGGTSVGGMVANRKQFGTLLAGVDHIPDTHIPELNAFSKGQPKHGVERADALNDIIALHDASTIAAVIVEPVAGSTGVLPPPLGYLERLREICDKNGILLIFDEVISGFGRLGSSFASERFNVIPDLMTMAKAITNATVPMGAVGVRKYIYDKLMETADNNIELFHGYTYSGHPLACAAALATLDLYEKEDLFQRSANMEAYFADAAHSYLSSLPAVIDIRTIGLVAGIELDPNISSNPKIAQEVFLNCYEKNVLVRYSGNSIVLSPPLIISKEQIDEIFDTLKTCIRAIK